MSCCRWVFSIMFVMMLPFPFGADEQGDVTPPLHISGYQIRDAAGHSVRLSLLTGRVLLVM
jgi:hypothetical protein